MLSCVFDSNYTGSLGKCGEKKITHLEGLQSLQLFCFQGCRARAGKRQLRRNDIRHPRKRVRVKCGSGGPSDPVMGVMG